MADRVVLVATALLAVGAIPALSASSFWGILHATLVAAGISALLVRDRLVKHVPGASRVVVLALLLCHLRADYVATLGFWGNLALGTLPVVAVAAAAAVLLHRDDARTGKVWIQAGVLSVLALLTILSWGLDATAGTASPATASLALAEIALLGLSAYIALRRSTAATVRLAGRIAVAPLVVGVFLGWWTVGSAYGHYREARARFAAGELDAARQGVSTLSRDFHHLHLESLSVRAWIAEVTAGMAGRGTVDRWTTLAGIAVDEYEWRAAASAYAQAATLDPANPRLRVRSAQCLFEAGERGESLAAIDRLARQADTVPVHLARAMAATRMGEMTVAHAAVTEALAAGWEPAQGRGANHEVWETTVAQLLPDGVDPRDAGMGLDDVARLLSAHGITLLHPPMTVGQTAVDIPVDVQVLVRPGDDPDVEGIIVDAEVLSTHKLGASFIAIDPVSGGVTGRLLRTMSGDEVASFVASLPVGSIVAGSIDDVGSRFHSRAAHQALRELGVVRRADPAWAHAFVGVRGSRWGSALEAVARGSALHLHVSAGQVARQATASEIHAAVQTAAQSAPAGIAMYASDLRLEAPVVVAHAVR